ncbi:MAG: adenylosuccinate synthetase [bacterium]|nr:adenylosuccinate synthetase [bacterium]
MSYEKVIGAAVTTKMAKRLDEECTRRALTMSDLMRELVEIGLTNSEKFLPAATKEDRKRFLVERLNKTHDEIRRVDEQLAAKGSS